jgi:hypothetical protein
LDPLRRRAAVAADAVYIGILRSPGRVRVAACRGAERPGADQDFPDNDIGWAALRVLLASVDEHPCVAVAGPRALEGALALRHQGGEVAVLCKVAPSAGDVAACARRL